MRDLNFFNGFIEDKKKKNKIITILFAVILVTFVSAFGSIAYLEIMVNIQKKGIEENNKLLASKVIKKQEEALEESIQQLREMNEFKDQVNSLVSFIENSSNVSTGNMIRIFNALPENVKITSFSFGEGSFSMQCKSNTPLDVYSAVRNLKAIGVKKVNFSTITTADEDGNDVQRFHLKGEISGGGGQI